MAGSLVEQVGKRIRVLRLRKGWRQVDLSANVQMNVGHLSDVERGKRELGLHLLERIAKALDVPPADLLR